MRYKIILAILLPLILGGLGTSYYFLIYDKEAATKPATTTQSSEAKQPEAEKKTAAEPPAEQPKPAEPPPFSKTQYSITDPTSIWVIVNKKRPLEATYAPADLTNVGGGLMRAEAAKALGNLLQASKDQGVPLQIISSYRSYSTQRSTYNAFVAKDGAPQADTYSARPGHSEHQTGLAVDLGSGTCNLEVCFANTTQGKWLASNAANYGFIIRYLEPKTSITGYQYEPWHIRYVGLDLAKELARSNLTMEEYFGIEPAPTY